MIDSLILIHFLATAEGKLEISSNGCPLNVFLEIQVSAEERGLLLNQTELSHSDFPSPGLQ